MTDLGGGTNKRISERDQSEKDDYVWVKKGK